MKRSWHFQAYFSLVHIQAEAESCHSVWTPSLAQTEVVHIKGQSLSSSHLLAQRSIRLTVSRASPSLLLKQLLKDRSSLLAPASGHWTSCLNKQLRLWLLSPGLAWSCQPTQSLVDLIGDGFDLSHLATTQQLHIVLLLYVSVLSKVREEKR